MPTGKEWKRLAMDGGTGLAFGVADQLVQNFDEKRALAARALAPSDPKYLAPDKKMPMLKEWGTALNYGLPVLDVIAVAMGWVKDEWATRLTTASFQLAGRKGTHRLTTKSTSSTPAAAYTQWQRQAAEQAMHQAAAREAAHQNLYVPTPNPQPIETGPSTPVVQPQSLYSGRGSLD